MFLILLFFRTKHPQFIWTSRKKHQNPSIRLVLWMQHWSPEEDADFNFSFIHFANNVQPTFTMTSCSQGNGPTLTYGVFSGQNLHFWHQQCQAAAKTSHFRLQKCISFVHPLRHLLFICQLKHFTQKSTRVTAQVPSRHTSPSSSCAPSPCCTPPAASSPPAFGALHSGTQCLKSAPIVVVNVSCGSQNQMVCTHISSPARRRPKAG